MTDDHYKTFKEIKPEDIVPKEITPSDQEGRYKMGNSLTIISRKEKEELYKDLEGKWLIELDGNKIENEDDFAVAIMNEIDIVYDYKNLYGYDWYSFRDAATELEMIREKKFKGSKTDVIIVYDSPRLKQSNAY